MLALLQVTQWFPYHHLTLDHTLFSRTWDDVLAPSKKQSLYLEVKLDWLFCLPTIWPKQIKSTNLFELLLTDLYIECNDYNNSAGLSIKRDTIIYVKLLLLFLEL